LPLSVEAGIGFQPGRAPQSTSGQVNTTLFLFCEASYDVNQYDLTYIWRFNGHLINLQNNFFFKEVISCTPLSVHYTRTQMYVVLLLGAYNYKDFKGFKENVK